MYIHTLYVYKTIRKSVVRELERWRFMEMTIIQKEDSLCNGRVLGFTTTLKKVRRSEEYKKGEKGMQKSEKKLKEIVAGEKNREKETKQRKKEK